VDGITPSGKSSKAYRLTPNDPNDASALLDRSGIEYRVCPDLPAIMADAWFGQQILTPA
jgi:hypothetical protein